MIVRAQGELSYHPAPFYRKSYKQIKMLFSCFTFLWLTSNSVFTLKENKIFIITSYAGMHMWQHAWLFFLPLYFSPSSALTKSFFLSLALFMDSLSLFILQPKTDYSWELTFQRLFNCRFRRPVAILNRASDIFQIDDRIRLIHDTHMTW